MGSWSVEKLNTFNARGKAFRFGSAPLSFARQARCKFIQSPNYVCKLNETSFAMLYEARDSDKCIQMAKTSEKAFFAASSKVFDVELEFRGNEFDLIFPKVIPIEFHRQKLNLSFYPV